MSQFIHILPHYVTVGNNTENHYDTRRMLSTKKPGTTMLTYPWKCTVLHCNHLGNTWKPLVLMTRHFDYCPSASEGDNQSVRSSAPVVSRRFPGGYNVKLYISRGRLAWWLLAFLHSDAQLFKSFKLVRSRQRNSNFVLRPITEYYLLLTEPFLPFLHKLHTVKVSYDRPRPNQLTKLLNMSEYEIHFCKEKGNTQRTNNKVLPA